MLEVGDVRGLLLVLQPESEDTPTGIKELIAPDGTMVVADHVYQAGDGDRLATAEGQTVLAIPHNAETDALEGNWLIQIASGAGRFEIWAAADDDGVRHVDIVVFTSEIRVFQTDLESRFEQALQLLGFELGTLELHLAEMRDTVDEDSAFVDYAVSSSGRDGAISVLLYEDVVGLDGKASVPGTLGAGERGNVIALEDDAAPLIIAHEIGHFVGLLHPVDGGGSDFLESTPLCPLDTVLDEPLSCPGSDNLMFRHITGSSLTDEQRFVIERSVIWHP